MTRSLRGYPDEIDQIVRRTIEEAGAKPSFLGYGGFPASACVSINDEVIHGIPSKKRVIRSGDIVKIDVGAYIGGFHGDCACTVACGEVSDEAKRLIEVTRQSFYEGIRFAREGCRVSRYFRPRCRPMLRPMVFRSCAPL